MQVRLPLGRLALEIDPENRPAHQLIAENFRGWIAAIRECVDQMAGRLPPTTDREALAIYVLAVMEGAVMLSRSYGAVEPFDRAVGQLREHFRLLLLKEGCEAALKSSRPEGRWNPAPFVKGCPGRNILQCPSYKGIWLETPPRSLRFNRDDGFCR